MPPCRARSGKSPSPPQAGAPTACSAYRCSGRPPVRIHFRRAGGSPRFPAPGGMPAALRRQAASWPAALSTIFLRSCMIRRTSRNQSPRHAAVLTTAIIHGIHTGIFRIPFPRPGRSPSRFYNTKSWAAKLVRGLKCIVLWPEMRRRQGDVPAAGRARARAGRYVHAGAAPLRQSAAAVHGRRDRRAVAERHVRQSRAHGTAKTPPAGEPAGGRLFYA